jgi:hypothetical protein
LARPERAQLTQPTAVKEYLDRVKQYPADADPLLIGSLYGYATGPALVGGLEQYGDRGWGFLD